MAATDGARPSGECLLDSQHLHRKRVAAKKEQMTLSRSVILLFSIFLVAF